MTVGSFDRKTSLLSAVALLMLILVLRSYVFSSSEPESVSASESIPAAERRLQKVRQLAALVPGKEAVLKQANTELATREKGLLTGDTVDQAKAQLLDVIHKAAASSGFDSRGLDQSNAKPLANDYGDVSVGVTFTCRIEELVNFLTTLANQPEILSTNEIRISGGNDKKKILQVQINLSGVVPGKLVPRKKAGSL